METHVRSRLGWTAAGVALLALALAYGSQSTPAAVVGTITPDALLSSPPAGALILDVRTPAEFAGGHVPGAVNLPYDTLGDAIDRLGADPGGPLVVYCESGRRAAKAEATLLAAGFTNVLHLEGDMRDWRERGRPTATPEASTATPEAPTATP
jgi:rhodanese-related sulfurtransferase